MLDMDILRLDKNGKRIPQEDWQCGSCGERISKRVADEEEPCPFCGKGYPYSCGI